MRELIFNQASTVNLAWSEPEAHASLVELAEGMAALVRFGHVDTSIRMACQLHELIVFEQQSLWEMLLALRKERIHRDAISFWFRLVQKMPLLAELPASVVDRFRGCEPLGEFGALSEGLILCAQNAGVAVSLPTDAKWKSSELEVHYMELMPGGDLCQVSESIDNLGSSVHAREIDARFRERNFANLTPAAFIDQKGNVFPHLEFGLDVDAQLRVIGGSQFWTIMNRLAELDEAAKLWKQSKGPAPKWKSLVSPESKSTMDDQTCVAARTFRNKSGVRQVFEWHARYGGSGRIHLCFDSTNQMIEIGYIGAHLPLPK